MSASDDPVTVVIPTRDRLPLLRRTLGTVLAQEDVDLSVVVVDEASSDGTAAFLADPGDPRVRTLRHERPEGVAKARNHGVRTATTPWVAFIDDDDLWAPTKLRDQLDAIGRDGEALWSCVGSVVVDPDLRIVRHSPVPRERDVADHILCYNHIPGGGSGVLVDRALVLDVGGFDPGLSTLADWDLWIRLGLRSPLAAVDAPRLAYVEHGGMSRSARNIEHELETMAERYADERQARGRSFEWGWWLRWLGELDERAGRRGSAIRHHLRAAKAGDRQGLGDAFRAIRGPAALRRTDGQEAARVPPGWESASERWLGPLRGAALS